MYSSKVYSLTVPPEKFQDMYNLDISGAVERHTFKESSQKGKGEINYLSWSHAMKLYRIHFPGWEVDCEHANTNGSYVFFEEHGAGMYMKPYLFVRHSDGTIARTSSIYFAILTSSGATAFPFTADGKINLSVANAQTYNRNYYRALTKAIAVHTGIGLKLWSGEDLTEDILDARLGLIELYHRISEAYRREIGEIESPVDPYELSVDGLRREIKNLQDKVKAKKEKDSHMLESTKTITAEII